MRTKTLKVFTTKRCHRCPQDAEYDIMIEQDGWHYVCSDHLFTKVPILSGYKLEVVNREAKAPAV